MEMAKKRDNWFYSDLTRDETYKDDGELVITNERYQEMVDSKIPISQLRREFYNDPDATLEGVIYQEEIASLIKHGHWRADVLIETSLPFYIAWDPAARSDANALIFYQKVNDDINIIHYYEQNNVKVVDIFEVIRSFSVRYGINLAIAWLPHDGANADYNLNTRFTLGRQHGLTLKRAWEPFKAPSKANQIDTVRMVFTRLRVKKCEETERFIECVKNYHRHYFSETQEWGDVVHDWSSHCTDALAVLAYIEMNKLNPTQVMNKILYNRVATKGVFG